MKKTALYIDRDNETYKVLSNQEIFRLVYGLEDFVKKCFVAERTASSYRQIANRFLHFIEKEGRKLDDIKAAGDFLTQLNVKNLSYSTALKWLYVYLEKQRMTNIHPLGDLKLNLSFFREPNPIIGKDSVLKPHDKHLSRQVHQNYQHNREIEFLQDELLKRDKIIRYMKHGVEDFLDAFDFSNLYHRPMTVGEAQKHFSLLRGAISYRGPSYIDRPSRVTGFQKTE